MTRNANPRKFIVAGQIVQTSGCNRASARTAASRLNAVLFCVMLNIASAMTEPIAWIAS
jgi:hypothetical protein